MNEQAQKLLDELVSKIENNEEFDAIRGWYSNEINSLPLPPFGIPN